MYDFSECSTTEELERELNLIAAAHTRKFVDEGINSKDSTENHTHWARNNGVEFLIGLDDDAPNGVYVQLLIPGHRIDDTLHRSGVQALVRGTIYGDEVIHPSVAPSVEAWKAARTA